MSNCIAKQDFSTLEGLVTNNVLEQVKSIVSNLNDNEIKDMAFDDNDMYFFLPVQLDIINDAKRKYMIEYLLIDIELFPAIYLNYAIQI